MQKIMNENAPLMRYTLILLVLFNVFFPKSGIKINEVPITVGMVLLFGVLFYLMIKSIISLDFLQVDKPRFCTLIGWFPFQLWLLLCVYFLGIADMGAVLSMGVNFIFLPITLLLFAGNYIWLLPKEFVYRWIVYGVTFVSIFGIIAFFYKLQTGDFIEIPFLTVNYDDYGNLDSKNIDRGLLTKLISTYQNGNIFGVSILMLLPLYNVLQKNAVLKIVVKVALVLTLSRTAWIGLILYEIFSAIYLFPSFKRAIVFVFSLIILGGGIASMLGMMEQDISFLLDPNLGGRLPALQSSYYFIPENPIQTISEIVYAGIAINFGLIGLIFFLLAVISPIIGWCMAGGGFNLERRSLLLGYVLYLIVAVSDGAILLIPVMIFYWFLVAMMVTRSVDIRTL